MRPQRDVTQTSSQDVNSWSFLQPLLLLLDFIWWTQTSSRTFWCDEVLTQEPSSEAPARSLWAPPIISHLNTPEPAPCWNKDLQSSERHQNLLHTLPAKPRATQQQVWRSQPPPLETSPFLDIPLKPADSPENLHQSLMTFLQNFLLWGPLVPPRPPPTNLTFRTRSGWFFREPRENLFTGQGRPEQNLHEEVGPEEPAAKLLQAPDVTALWTVAVLSSRTSSERHPVHPVLQTHCSPQRRPADTAAARSTTMK